MVEPGLQARDSTDLLYDDAVIQLRARHPYLIIFIGQDGGKRYRLNIGQTTVGRSPQADITIHDHRVSRIHCIIEWNGEILTIADQGSTNGTFVDSKKIDRVKLNAGIPIQLGHSLMKVEYKDASEIRSEENLLQQVSADPLTGIFSHQHFMKLASMEMSYACRHQLTACIILMSIDNFNHVIQTHGHLTGDFVLVQSAAIVNQTTRAEDLLARYTDEKFIIMPRGDIDGEDMLFQCERIHKAIKGYTFRFGDDCIRVTTSIGFHSEKVSGRDYNAKLADLISKAEQALYRAIEKGNDRIESFI
jgi:diguanylate cyclase (GGDEF)-like protein